jgi:hypothetical protein
VCCFCHQDLFFALRFRDDSETPHTVRYDCAVSFRGTPVLPFFRFRIGFCFGVDSRWINFSFTESLGEGALPDVRAAVWLVERHDHSVSLSLKMASRSAFGWQLLVL